MLTDNDLENFTAEEYEIQHYGFSSTEFVTQFTSTVNEAIESVHKDLEECISVKMKLNDEQRVKLHQEMNTFTKLYMNRAKELLKKFESEGRDFFAIPRNVLLESDAVHDISESKSINKIQEEIKDLEQQYLKEKTLLVLYKNELDEAKQFDKYQKPLKKLLREIDRISDSRLTDAEKINKIYERLYEQLQSTIDPEKINSRCNNLCHQSKFVLS